jgi:hypothetical protein
MRRTLALGAKATSNPTRTPRPISHRSRSPVWESTITGERGTSLEFSTQSRARQGVEPTRRKSADLPPLMTVPFCRRTDSRFANADHDYRVVADYPPLPVPTLAEVPVEWAAYPRHGVPICAICTSG